MELNISLINGVTVVELAGEVIETPDQEALRKQTAEALGRCNGKMVMDLSGVTYLCSGAIGTMVVAHRELEKLGQALRIAGPSTKVRDVLHASKLDQLFDTHDTIDDAISSCDPA